MASNSSSSGLPDDSNRESLEESSGGAADAPISGISGGPVDSTSTGSRSADSGLESLEPLPASPSTEASTGSAQPSKWIDKLASQFSEAIGSSVESATKERGTQTDRSDASYIEKQSPQAALELERLTESFRAEIEAASRRPEVSSEHVVEGNGGLKLGGSSEAASAATSSVESRDAFILFNEAESEVEAIVQSLQKQGVTVYFWRQDIAFGENWQIREDAELQACRCVLLFLGRAGWGPTHAEIAVNAVRLDKQIIPVLISDYSQSDLEKIDPVFLKLRRVDLCPPTPTLIRGLANRIRALRPKEAVKNIAKAVAIRNTFGIAREAASGEGRLDVHKYADVIARLIKSIGNAESLSFAILAPWGRGKTYLMRLVGRQLETQSYRVVTFSAWKYRTAPEVWAYLYETLHHNACNSSWLVPLRTGLLRCGLWPITFTLLMLSLTLATFTQKVAMISSVASLFGFVGTLYLMGMSSKLYRAGKSLRSTYLELPRHHERLGLQFAIGTDLKALLQGWMPDVMSLKEAVAKVFVWRSLSTVSYCLSVIAVCYTLRAAAILVAEENFAASIGVIFALGIVACGGIAPACVFVVSTPKDERVLLVVDDLDRCPPEQMLDIIECLQLFLDDEDVKKRLKIVMLVEEAILREALRNKYVTALRLQDNDLDKIGQLVTDNLEKLFLCWIRLEPLRPAELKDIFEGICDSLGPPSVTHPGAGSGPVASPPKVATAKVEELKTGPGAGVATPPDMNATTDTQGVKPETVEFSLSDDERRAIVSLIDDIQFEAGRDSWGPRAARCFVFPYQLARMLLNALGHEFLPHDLVSALAVAANPDFEGERSVDTVLFRIARQVS